MLLFFCEKNQNLLDIQATWEKYEASWNFCVVFTTGF